MAKLLKAVVWIGGIGAVIVLLLRWWAISMWTIPDDAVLNASIYPTLASGDVVLVWRRGDRAPADLVRCPDPETPTDWVVGRIAAFERDTLELNGRDMFLNGNRIDSRHACDNASRDVIHPVSGETVEMHCDVVEWNGGIHMRGMQAKQSGFPISPMKTTVASGKVFLVSDNRTHHDDSRDYGALPKEACTELIFFRLWGKNGFSDSSRRFDWIH